MKSGTGNAPDKTSRPYLQLDERLENLAEAPPSERRVAQFLSASVLDVPFLTVQAVADQTGVSKATVVRTARRMGYPSFTSLREEARRLLFAEPSSPLGRARLLETHSPWEELAGAYRARQVTNLQFTLSRIDARALEELACDLIEARMVFIYGLRYSYALAYHLWLRLAALLPRAQLVHALGGTAADTVVTAGPEDYAILFAHQRIGREKELLAEFLSGRRCPYSVVTDAHPSRVSKGARHAFLTATRGVGAFNSYVSSLAVAELIALAVEQKVEQKGGDVEDLLARSEEVWAQLDLFVRR